MRVLRLAITAFVLAVALAFADGCGAVTLDVTAGGIAAGTLVGKEESALTLRGSVNAADLDWIARNCRELRSLDMREVTVEPCRLEKGLATGLREFPGGVLPAYSLSGLAAQELVLPEGITEISDGALLGAAVTDIVLPESVVRIGVSAFAGCGALRSVRLGDRLECIGRYAFRGCAELVSVEAGGGCLREIGDRAFSGCLKLETFGFVSSAPALAAVGEEAFSSSGLRSLDLSACTGLQTIGPRAFSGCASLEELRLPPSVTEMGEGVLFGCESLREFSLPESVVRIPDMALTGASGISDAAALLHQGVSQIGDYSLAGIETPGEVALPESLQRIGTGAFEGWTSLTFVDAENLKSVPELGNAVWAGVNCPETILSVAKGMETEFASADQWKDFIIRIPDESTLDRLPVADSAAGSLIEARLVNSVLTVRTSEGMSEVALYDTDGRRVFISAAKGECSLTVPTGLPAGKICIAAVRFVSDKVAGIKLINTSLQ